MMGIPHDEMDVVVVAKTKYVETELLTPESDVMTGIQHDEMDVVQYVR